MSNRSSRRKLRDLSEDTDDTAPTVIRFGQEEPNPPPAPVRNPAPAANPTPVRKPIPVIKVTPEAPVEPERLAVLKNNLANMGCAGFMDFPWEIRDESLVADLLYPVPRSITDTTMRAKPEQWTPELWRGVYAFEEKADKKMEKRMECLEGQFKGAADPREGYQLSDVIDPESQDVVRYLNPILHPSKSKRVIGKVASTILGSFRGYLQVDWGCIIATLVEEMVQALLKGKKGGTPLPVYLSHLYANKQWMTPDEENHYLHAGRFMNYGGRDQSVTNPDSDRESVENKDQGPGNSPGKDSSPDVGPSAPRHSPPKGKEKLTEESPPKRNPEIRRSLEQELQHEGVRLPADRYQIRMNGTAYEDIYELSQHVVWRAREVDKINANYYAVLEKVCSKMGLTDRNAIFRRTDQLVAAEKQSIEMEKLAATLQTENAGLKLKGREDAGKITALETEALQLRTQLGLAKKMAHDQEQGFQRQTIENLEQIRTALEVPIDHVAKARIVDEGLDVTARKTRIHILNCLFDQTQKMEDARLAMQRLVARFFPQQPDNAGLVDPVPANPGPSNPVPGAAQPADPATTLPSQVIDLGPDEDEIMQDFNNVPVLAHITSPQSVSLRTWAVKERGTIPPLSLDGEQTGESPVKTSPSNRLKHTRRDSRGPVDQVPDLNPIIRPVVTVVPRAVSQTGETEGVFRDPLPVVRGSPADVPMPDMEVSSPQAGSFTQLFDQAVQHPAPSGSPGTPGADV